MSDNDTNTADADDIREVTFLDTGGIKQRMKCSGQVASTIKSTFVTAEQLLDAVESEDDLTDRDGIGPKTAGLIEEWYENREERERSVRHATMTRTSSKSATISFHRPWTDALGIEDSAEEVSE